MFDKCVGEITTKYKNVLIEINS